MSSSLSDQEQQIEGYQFPVLRTSTSASRLHLPERTGEVLKPSCKSGLHSEAKYIVDELSQIRSWREPCGECFPRGLPGGDD